MPIDPGPRLTFDLSFVIRAVQPGESGHAAANALLNSLGSDVRSGRRKLVEPAFFLIELLAVAGRRAAQLDWNLMQQAMQFPFDVEAFDARACETLMGTLNEHFPQERRPHIGRGADLVYLAVARAASTVLISCDNGLLGFNGPHFRVVSPEECL